LLPETLRVPTGRESEKFVGICVPCAIAFSFSCGLSDSKIVLAWLYREEAVEKGLPETDDAVDEGSEDGPQLAFSPPGAVDMVELLECSRPAAQDAGRVMLPPMSFCSWLHPRSITSS